MSISLKVLLMSLGVALAAQDRVAPVSWSAEIDVLPFATGGWYGSLATGKGPWRIRGAMAEVHVPDRFAPTGWEGPRIRATAVLVDRFFREDATGPWMGTGLERWEERYRLQGQTVSARLQSLHATLGGGWVFDLGGGLTLNPWLALHQRIAGDRQASPGGRTCRPNPLQAEASIKLGYTWR